MGADGGTIPKRCELVKKKKKDEKLEKAIKNNTKWKNCQMTQQPLKKPVIACRLGRLYNKETVIEAILTKTIHNFPAAAHLKGMKDFKELTLTENKDFSGENVKGDSYQDHNQTQFLCPVTSIPMNGNQNFVVNWNCGCVFSEKAMQEVKSDVCHGCGGSWDAKDSVQLNPSDELLEVYKQRLADEKAEKKTKKDKKEKKDDDKEKPKKAEKRKAESNDIQSDSTKSDTYKKLFTTSEEAKNKPMLSVPRVASRGTAVLALRSIQASRNVILQTRLISSQDVFNVSKTTSFDIPAVPLPPVPGRTLEDMIEGGESVLSELGLFSWWKPSSYFRVALEGIHHTADIPWWGTIVCATIALRLALIVVPIMSQRLVAKQSQYKKELDEFKSRIEDARKEGNNMLQQQIFLEQRDFLRSKDIKLGRQFLILMANGGVFMTQFFAIKKMVEVNYPGLSTGGTAWFTDLTLADPYYALPLISAVTMGIVSRVGIEMGTSSDQMTPAMKLGMTYGLPVIIFAVSSQFASGLCVYWCASNMMSLVYSGAFRTPAIRKLFNIPPMVHHVKTTKEKNAFKQVWSNWRERSAAPPSLAQLREQDVQQFKKAGRGKPIIK